MVLVLPACSTLKHFLHCLYVSGLFFTVCNVANVFSVFFFLHLCLQKAEDGCDLTVSPQLCAPQCCLCEWVAPPPCRQHMHDRERIYLF